MKTLQAITQNYKKKMIKLYIKDGKNNSHYAEYLITKDKTTLHTRKVGREEKTKQYYLENKRYVWLKDKVFEYLN